MVFISRLKALSYTPTVSHSKANNTCSFTVEMLEIRPRYSFKSALLFCAQRSAKFVKILLKNCRKFLEGQLWDPAQEKH